MNTDFDCPCESGKKYKDCCFLAHCGKHFADTAVALMRSRYSAYALKISDYICKTTHPKFRGKDFKEDVEKWMQQTRWTHLEILDRLKGEADDKVGEVEFIAEFFLDGQSQILHERSNFVRYKGRWVYTEGKVSPK